MLYLLHILCLLGSAHMCHYREVYWLSQRSLLTSCPLSSPPLPSPLLPSLFLSSLNLAPTQNYIIFSVLTCLGIVGVFLFFFLRPVTRLRRVWQLHNSVLMSIIIIVCILDGKVIPLSDALEEYLMLHKQPTTALLSPC